jgi:hypothetical protein
MNDWPYKIPDRKRYRKGYVDALEDAVRNLRRQITRQHWNPQQTEAETLLCYTAAAGATPKEWAKNETAVLEQREQSYRITRATQTPASDTPASAQSPQSAPVPHSKLP